MARVTQQHVDARRESILDSAAQLFARKGFSSTTMADIAADADLSAGAIYRYFSSKDELMRAVFDDAVERNQQMFQSAAEDASSPFEALVKIGRRNWIDFDDRDDLICQIQMALTAARDPEDFGLELSEIRRVVRGMLEQMIRAAQESGEISPDVDPATLALILQAATGGIQMLKLEETEPLDVESGFELLVRMVADLGFDRPRSHDSHER